VARRHDADRAGARAYLGPGRRANRVVPAWFSRYRVHLAQGCAAAGRRGVAGGGALAGAGLAAMPDSPFTKAVIMSVPIGAACRPLGRVPQSGRLAAKLPRQLLHSWCPRNTPNCTGTGCRRPDCPPSICTAQTTAAPRTTRRGLSGCYPMKASSRSSKTPDTSCSSISDVVARHIVDFVGQAS
jgi:hypothetical protein